MATLVVGDGNFSFSLSLARHVEMTNRENLVATSLETEQEIAKRPMGEENVIQLRELGVCVLHGVDGTALHTDHRLNQRLYHKIIFNFPHTGGKSNIKHNRQLLRDFFASASQMVSRDGAVSVTLCRGQGGTPVDSVQRGPGNSWRIIDMATEASLMLSQVRCFNPADHPGYVPTGYRSGVKGFILHGALEHIFTLPQIDMEPFEKKKYTEEKEVEEVSTFYDVCKVCCCAGEEVETAEIQRQLTERGLCYHQTLLSLPWHPVSRVHQLLVNSLEQTQSVEELWCKVVSELRQRVTVHSSPSICSPSCSNTGIWWTNGTEHLKQTTQENLPNKFMLQSSSSQLIPSLTERTSESSCDLPILHIVSAPMVRETPITPDPSLQPLSHHLCGLLQLPSSFRPLTIIAKSLKQSLILTLQTLLSVSLQNSSLLPGSANESISSSTCDDINVLLSNGETATLVTFPVNEQGLPPHLSFSVSLDVLAMAVFQIPHIQLLWCNDRRFVEQFIEHDRKELTIAFKPFNIFSPIYSHDVSFWIPLGEVKGHDEGQERVERLVIRTVRGVAGSKVMRVVHLETYMEEGESEGGVVRRVSLCYRVEYGGVGGGGVVSWSDSRELQLRVRERLVRDIPGLQLR